MKDGAYYEGEFVDDEIQVRAYSLVATLAIFFLSSRSGTYMNQLTQQRVSHSISICTGYLETANSVWYA